MKTPTQEEFQTVIDNLEKINTVLCRVDMFEVEVNHCGSPMCHGGWYAVACGMDVYFGLDLSFSDGANKMAEDLGFNNQQELKLWAMNNADIWGNENGFGLFSDVFAFGDGLVTVESLTDIITHWKNVKERAASL